MNLQLANIRHPLLPFVLEVNASLRGRVTAFFGGSGAGKTTLLEIIAGIRHPLHGTLTLDGTTLINTATRTLVPPNHRAIGYVPQEGALFPHLNVRQNLLYGTRPPTPPTTANESNAFTYKHVTEVLEIAPLATRAVETLSGGEKQRVALGRALLSHPRLLLLDEPLAGLDAALKDRLLPYLIKIRDEFRIPMIYVTHSADEVMQLCDDVLVLNRGVLVRQGAPETLFTASSQPRYILRANT